MNQKEMFKRAIKAAAAKSGGKSVEAMVGLAKGYRYVTPQEVAEVRGLVRGIARKYGLRVSVKAGTGSVGGSVAIFSGDEGNPEARAELGRELLKRGYDSIFAYQPGLNLQDHYIRLAEQHGHGLLNTTLVKKDDSRMGSERLYEATHKLAAEHPELRQHLVPILRRYAAAGPQVSIYHLGAAGQLQKIEGFLTGFSALGGVKFIPKRGRQERMIMTYYSHYINVVAGWGHPDPQSMWDESTRQEGDGVVTQRGRYRSTDPRWITDFMNSPAGKSLKTILLFENGHLKLNHTGMKPSN